MTKVVSETDANKGLFIWTPEYLKAATQSLHGDWQDSSNRHLKSFKASKIITDTRKIKAGDIFLAIVGDNFDGHDFVETAVEKGAAAVIVDHKIKDIDVPQLIVEDTRLAFGKLAAYRRQQHPNLKVIALTGSSGKTTVKEMLRGIFKQLESNQSANTEHSDELTQTLVTRGNLNNDYGVPMMLLELQQQHRYAVLELGANHVGEIAYTTDLVKPDVACILNIGTAHLGEFGGRDNIAKTKAEIYQSLQDANIAIVPSDDDYSPYLFEQASQYTHQVLLFGTHPANLSLGQSQPDISASNIVSSASESQFTLRVNQSTIKSANPDSTDSIQPCELSQHETVEVDINLPLPGAHNISNALAAAACASALGIDLQTIAHGLNRAATTKGRLYHSRLGRHKIIDDTYNANPNSVRAAAAVLAVQAGFKILVLGDIGELGSAAEDEHQALGKAIANINTDTGGSIDMLLCAGEFAADTVNGAKSKGMTSAFAFDGKQALLVKLMQVLEEKELEAKKNQASVCTLLFKGSRSAAMETVIEALSDVQK